jgi:hypothetical protein
MLSEGGAMFSDHRRSRGAVVEGGLAAGAPP